MAVTDSYYAPPVGMIEDNTIMLPVAAGQKIFRNALVVFQAGFARKAITSTTVKAIGLCENEVDNTNGANGALRVRVRTGEVYGMKNSAAADEITLADIGTVCFIVDDNTVAKTNGGGTRSKCGVVNALRDGYVMVHIDYRKVI
jgi:hypothetical protein